MSLFTYVATVSFFERYSRRASERGVCAWLCIYYNYVEPFLKDDSDDLTQKGSKFQSEHVLGTKECMYALVRQKGI